MKAAAMRAPLSVILLFACATSNPRSDQAPQAAPDSLTGQVKTTFLQSSDKEIIHPVFLSCPPPAVLNRPRGTVVVTFVVDTAGRPEPESVKVISSTNDSLTGIALTMAVGCRYKPGSWRGHLLRLPIEQPFSF